MLKFLLKSLLIPKTTILFYLFFNPVFSKVIINEVYFETLDSKYYNQAVEVYNSGSETVNLGSLTLIAGKVINHTFIGSRTNQIISWTISQQNQLSSMFNNLSFSLLLPPKETAVILDPGYRFEEKFAFTNQIRSNTLYLLTVSTSVIGTGNFMKADDVLRLESHQPSQSSSKTIDEFYNRTSPQGYSVVKINRSLKGLIDNITSRPQTIGYIEDLHDLYTTLPPDHLSLDQITGNITIVGLPQVYNLTCKHLTAVSQLCNQTVRFQRHDFIKMYHYPNRSANLITEKDDIVLNSGQSSPITLFSLEPGLHRIGIHNNSFPPLEKTVKNFNAPQASEVFITEIYYNTNKNLTWIEVYSKNGHTLPLKIETFNGDYRQNHSFDLGNVTIGRGYHVLGYRNKEFNQYFPLTKPVVTIPEKFAITAKGVIALSYQNKYLDIVHYDKNWFADSVTGRSLQRVDNRIYAFNKNVWSVSTEVDSTPFAPNVLTRKIDFTIKILDSRTLSTNPKIKFLADFDVSGELEVYLYNFQGYRIGKVFSQKVSRGYRTPLLICLQEVQKRHGLSPDEYSFTFVFTYSEGRKILRQNFIVE